MSEPGLAGLWSAQPLWRQQWWGALPHLHPASCICHLQLWVHLSNIVAPDSDLPVFWFWWSQQDVFLFLIGQFSSEFLRRLYPSHLQGVSVRRVLSGVSAQWNAERDSVCVFVCKWFVYNIGCGHIAKISLFFSRFYRLWHSYLCIGQWHDTHHFICSFSKINKI